MRRAFSLLAEMYAWLNSTLVITIEDIIKFFLENAHRSKELSDEIFLVGPIIESWVGLDERDRVVIQGRLHNHPKYPQGIKITTSSVQRCFTNGGRVYVKTKNSTYELGTPLNESDFELDIADFSDQ